MTLILKSISAILITTLAGSYACACTTGDLTNDQLVASPEIQLIQTKIQEKYGLPTEVKDIVRSGSEILNLDRKVVANAMCSANYINVFFKVGGTDEIQCMTTVEISNSGRFVTTNMVPGAVCRGSASAQEEFIDTSSR
ncbi:MAG: hypothetical protein EOP04_13465 [Proteobacteria bacterium]|nr:MAG: hypothetical protein EOP04_13465 [Pseudomonadota bacterium]